jgi:hypothetical protein
MAGPQNQPDEATMDLLIKQVTEGLSPAEARALDVLDSEVASGLARAASRGIWSAPRPRSRWPERRPQRRLWRRDCATVSRRRRAISSRSPLLTRPDPS